VIILPIMPVAAMSVSSASPPLTNSLRSSASAGALLLDDAQWFLGRDGVDAGERKGEIDETANRLGKLESQKLSLPENSLDNHPKESYVSSLRRGLRAET
jgi:hypothetical protein